jgi:hypothetical protein
MKKFCILAGILALFTQAAWGTDYTWNSPTGTFNHTDWITPANWTPNSGYPGFAAGDTATFPSTFLGTISFDPSLLLNDLAALDFTGGSGASLTMTGAANIGQLDVQGGTVNAVNLTVGTTLSVSGGSTLNTSNVTVTGAVANGGTLAVGSNTLTAGGGLTNTGTLNAAGGTLAVTGNFVNSGTVTGAPALTLAGSGSVDPGGAVFGAVAAAGGTLTTALTAASLNVTSGTFTLNAGVTVTGIVLNSGTLNAGSNTLTAGGGLTNTGTLTAAGGTLAVTGTIANSGT